jgi:hypothetical protein
MNHPFSGRLIDGAASYKWLADNSSSVNGQVSICSAFLRSSILEDLSLRLPRNSSVRVLVRWQLSDLLAGASDLEAYQVSKRHGWDFNICINFHGKVFCFPPGGILVGSANATGAGMGLLSNSNSEVCTIVEDTEFNRQHVNKLFQSSIRMDDILFNKMKLAYDINLITKEHIDWPDSIYEKIRPLTNTSDKLLLSECLLSNGKEILLESKSNTHYAKCDASLLSLPSGEFDHEFIAYRLKQTKIFQFLLQLLEKEGGEVYFGTLTAKLHDYLVEDPTPHRREIKLLVQNIYSWVNYLSPLLTLKVDKPNHSERIRINCC